MMNCEDYRQEIATDPTFDGGAGHLSTCAECQAFRAEMQSLDASLAKAMQINVPDMKLPELPSIAYENIADENIAAENVVTLTTRQRLNKPTWFALAASIMVAAVIGVRMFGIGATYDSLAEEVVAHLDHEPAALRVSSKPVSDSRLARVVPADVAQLDHSAGLISYAQSCTINGKKVPHLVIQGEHGPVTILLMPDERVAEAVVLDGDNIHGAILPVGAGSIAIIGAREEKLERIEKSVLNSVMWST